MIQRILLGLLPGDRVEKVVARVPRVVGAGRLCIDQLADRVRFHHRLVQQAAGSASTTPGTPS